MPSDATVSIVVSGVVGVAGIAVPAVTTWLTKRADRTHDLALKRVDNVERRRAHLAECRERLYLDASRVNLAFAHLINAVASGDDPSTERAEYNAVENGSNEPLGVAIDAYASDAARDLLHRWSAVQEDVLEILDGDADDDAKSALARDAWDLVERVRETLREELQAIDLP